MELFDQDHAYTGSVIPETELEIVAVAPKVMEDEGDADKVTDAEPEEPVSVKVRATW